MGNILETTFMGLLLVSGLSGILGIILLIAQVFIENTDKKQSLDEVVKVSLLICFISFCVGFGLCTFSLTNIGV